MTFTLKQPQEMHCIVSGAIFHYGYLQVYTKEVDSLGTFSQELGFKY